MSSTTYAEALKSYTQGSPFSRSSASSPFLAYFLLTLAFALALYFSTFTSKKGIAPQAVGAGLLASAVGAVGIICAFSAIGVNV